MSLIDRASELKDLIFEAMESVVQRLREKYQHQDIYALVFYPSSGYRDLGISYAIHADLELQSSDSESLLDPALLEMLKEHPDLMQKALARRPSRHYFEVNACEWAGASSCTDLFSGVNDLIQSEYDALYDEGMDNGEICQLFEEVLTDVLQRLRSSGMLSGPAFTGDVLLGVQFPDAANSEVVKRVSRKVNSADWHERLCAGYGNH